MIANGRALSAVAFAGLLASAAWAADSRIAVQVSGNSLQVQPLVAAGEIQVRVLGPGGFAFERSVPAGESVSLTLADGALADGSYRYELTAAPAAKRVRGAALREPPAEGFVESGAFQVANGQVVAAGVAEPKGATGTAAVPGPETTFTDSLCVGFDCPAGPVFNDTTILMMENNTRIKYDDTSSSPGFTNCDWALNANDSASGGLNRFWIQDCGTSSGGGCTGNAVFSIEAGARANSVFVDDTGRLGLGTATPQLDIHDKRGNTPAIRLEQDNSNGFTAQTWDIAGNEANFFVRDVTGGSRLPFRIRPGAPTSALDISSSGLLGVGTQLPAKAIHVVRNDGDAQVFIQDTSAAAATRTLMQLSNNGAVRFNLANTATAVSWAVDNDAAGNYVINKVDGDGAELTLDGAGNLTITGIYSPSDRALKRDVVEVDPQAVLAKLAGIPISSWRYKQQGDELHIGPMAQDFVGAFGVGPDDKRVSAADVGGVALAAIQALVKQNAELAARVAALERAAGRTQGP